MVGGWMKTLLEAEGKTPRTVVLDSLKHPVGRMTWDRWVDSMVAEVDKAEAAEAAVQRSGQKQRPQSDATWEADAVALRDCGSPWRERSGGGGRRRPSRSWRRLPRRSPARRPRKRTPPAAPAAAAAGPASTTCSGQGSAASTTRVAEANNASSVTTPCCGRLAATGPQQRPRQLEEAPSSLRGEASRLQLGPASGPRQLPRGEAKAATELRPRAIARQEKRAQPSLASARAAKTSWAAVLASRKRAWRPLAAEAKKHKKQVKADRKRVQKKFFDDHDIEAPPAEDIADNDAGLPAPAISAQGRFVELWAKFGSWGICKDYLLGGLLEPEHFTPAH